MNTGVTCKYAGCGKVCASEKEARQCELKHLVDIEGQCLKDLCKPEVDPEISTHLHYIGVAIHGFLKDHQQILGVSDDTIRNYED